jgi:hypothetical protein
MGAQRPAGPVQGWPEQPGAEGQAAENRRQDRHDGEAPKDSMSRPLHATW